MRTEKRELLDGVLVVDKPSGLTSHDVVAVARRALRERRIGHTGTLDPLATGVLPLACGRATRLVRFMVSSDKDYEAGIRFGLSTDTYDITGRERARSDLVPTREAIAAALEPLRGDYLQMPPAYSAKKVAGQRAYDLARRDEEVTLTPVPVRVTRAELREFKDASAQVAITCSSGFYVRSFAHALGEAVGTGACLESLRRTRSGDFSLDRAVDLSQLSAGPDAIADRWIPLDSLLPGLPFVRLTEEGCRRVARGQDVGPAHLIEGSDTRHAGGEQLEHTGHFEDAWFRLIDERDRLLSLGRQTPDRSSFHPAVVLLESSV